MSDAATHLERTFMSPASIRGIKLLREWMEDAGLSTLALAPLSLVYSPYLQNFALVNFEKKNNWIFADGLITWGMYMVEWNQRMEAPRLFLLVLIW